MAVMTNIPADIATLGVAAATNWGKDNEDWLQKLFEKHDAWIAEAEVEKHQAAYDGAMDSIESRDKSRGDDVNNKLYTNMAQLIIDTPVDYMLGKPIVWTIDKVAKDTNEKGEVVEVDKDLLENYRNEIIALLRGEEAQTVLSEQLRQGSIAGYSTVITWVDEDGDIIYEEYPVQEAIPVYDTRGRLKLFVRKYTVEDGDVKKMAVEVYDRRYVTYYIGDDKGKNLVLNSEELETGNPIEHKAGTIPVSIFTNGTAARYEVRKQKAGTSDLGNGVFSLLENYAAVMSDKANTAENLLDQYLLLAGVDVDEKEVIKMRKARAIALKSKESRADFIAPKQEDAAIENHLDRVQASIHDSTFIPKLNGISGATAMEIRMKYATLDIKAGKKEVYFTRAIKSFIRILTDMLNAKRLVEAKVENFYDYIGSHKTEGAELKQPPIPLYKPHWLQFTINRNLPQNFNEIASIVARLVDIVPDVYLYELLWFIDDPVTAIEEMRVQRAEKAEAAAKANLASMGYGGEFAETGTQEDEGSEE